MDKNESNNANNGLKVMLFTSPTCPNCLPAKDFIKEFAKKRTDFELFIFSVTEAEGNKYAAAFNVRSVPTFIIQGPATEENFGLIGDQGEHSINKYLDLASGKQKQEGKEKKKKVFKLGKYRIKF